MELFASPMACSLASHITALEAGLPVKVRFVENKKTDDGGDYYQISANGYVPALQAGRRPDPERGPVGAAVPGRRASPRRAWRRPGARVERYQLIDTLNYLSTELHKRIFYNVFNPKAADRPRKPPVRCSSRPSTTSRRSSAPATIWWATAFTVADAYLVDDAELGGVPQGRPREVADHRRLPPEAPQAPGGRPGDGRRDGRTAAPRGLVFLFRTAASGRLMIMSRPEAGGPEDYEAFLLSTANRSFGAFSRAAGP